MRPFFLFAAALTGLAQAPADIRIDVNEVTVSVSVSDRNGAPAKNLRREDFTLFDDGEPRQIGSFWQESDLPLTIGLVADVSGSQMGVIGKHRETIDRFLAQVLRPQDRAFLVTIGNRDVKLVTDLTHSLDELRAGLEGVGRGQTLGVELGDSCKSRRFGRCGTPLWDGIYAVARLKMKPLAGRKAVILLSDGMDVGSARSVTDAIEAAQSADTLVYSIRTLGTLAKYSPAARLRAELTKSMQRLSNETGGKQFSSSSDSVFAEIENDLRNLYVLGFTPPEEARDGKFHKLEVKVSNPELRVRARKGYAVPVTAK